MDLILLATIPYSGTNFVANLLANHDDILELKPEYMSWLKYRGITLPYTEPDFMERVKYEFPLRCKYIYIQSHTDEFLAKYLIKFKPVDFQVITTIRNPYHNLRSAILQCPDYDSLNEFIAVAVRYLTLLHMIKTENPIVIPIDIADNKFEYAIDMFGELGLALNKKVVDIIMNWEPVNIGEYKRELTQDEDNFIREIIERLNLINKIKEVVNVEYNLS